MKNKEPSIQIPELKKINHPPLHPWWRKMVHIVVLAIGWLLYFYLIEHNWAQGNKDVFAFIGLYISGCLVLVSAVTVFWIIHNISIYKRKPHRTELIPCEEEYDYDWDKKQIVSDWKKMRDSSNITISVEANKKIYTAN